MHSPRKLNIADSIHVMNLNKPTFAVLPYSAVLFCHSTSTTHIVAENQWNIQEYSLWGATTILTAAVPTTTVPTNLGQPHGLWFSVVQIHITLMSVA